MKGCSSEATDPSSESRQCLSPVLASSMGLERQVSAPPGRHIWEGGPLVLHVILKSNQARPPNRPAGKSSGKKQDVQWPCWLTDHLVSLCVSLWSSYKGAALVPTPVPRPLDSGIPKGLFPVRVWGWGPGPTPPTSFPMETWLIPANQQAVLPTPLQLSFQQLQVWAWTLIGCVWKIL